MKRAPGMTGVGTRAARSMSSRLQGSRGQVALWRPITLHWRRSPRPRTPHLDSARAGSWMSIFAPRVVLHFLSNLSAFARSTLFATTRSVVQAQLIRRDVILQHRETLREHVSREQTLSRVRERYSTRARVDFLLARFQGCLDAPRRAGSSPQVQPTRGFSVTARSTALTMRVSNSFVNHKSYSASSFMAALAPAFHPARASRKFPFRRALARNPPHRTRLASAATGREVRDSRYPPPLP